MQQTYNSRAKRLATKWSGRAKRGSLTTKGRAESMHILTTHTNRVHTLTTSTKTPRHTLITAETEKGDEDSEKRTFHVHSALRLLLNIPTANTPGFHVYTEVDPYPRKMVERT